MSFLNNFIREEVVKDYELLPPGDHRVIVEEVAVTNDHVANYKTGQMKPADKLPEWKNVMEQVAVKFKKVDDKGKTLGTLTVRYHSQGWVRYEELSEEQREGYYASGDELYAVSNDTNERLEDPVRTAQCKNIFMELFASAGVPVGTKGIEALTGRELIINVYNKPYKGEDKLRVRRPRPIPVETPSEVVAEDKEFAESA